MARIPIVDIKAGLNERVEEFCVRYLPSGHRDGKHWKIGDILGNAPSGGHGGSTLVDLSGDQVGKWHDFAGGPESEHGDLLDILEAQFGKNYLREAKAFLGWSDDKPHEPAPKPNPKTAEDEQAERKKIQESALAMFKEALPLPGTPAEDYLRGRGIDLDPWPAVLAFKTRTRFKAAEAAHANAPKVYVPSLLCLVQDAARADVGIQRVFLDPNNPTQKYPLPAHCKKSLGPVKGGAIHFTPVNKPVIVVCEGPENGLSLLVMASANGWLDEWPVSIWACVGVSTMPALQLPANCEEIWIFADNDSPDKKGRKAGQAMAEKAASAFLAAGKRAKVIMPPTPDEDWNDILKKLGPEMGGEAVRRMVMNAQIMDPADRPEPTASPKDGAGPFASDKDTFAGSRFYEKAKPAADDPSDPGPQQSCADAPLVLDPSAPLPSAREFVQRHFTGQGHPILHHHAGLFYRWDGTHYVSADDAAIRAMLWKFLDGGTILKRGVTAPFKPNRLRVTNVMDALKAICNLDGAVAAPTWLESGKGPPPTELIATRNGLLYLATRKLLEHSPTFFSLNALDFDYDQDARDPSEWLRFLNSLWPNDSESIGALQELFGLLLTGDTRHQKMFLIVGPKRSGKGTIARVLTALLGRDSVCAPTLAGLSQNFGLAPLIGKHVAIIADARLSSRADLAIVAERLLSISGEDELTIDRKFLPARTGRLPVRFVILTNELPRLADASGALASRFIIWSLEASFFGREDHGLTERLLAELPAILNWSITGWERLQGRGRFVQPAAAMDTVAELEDLASPIGAFLRQCCAIAPGLTVTCDALYAAWKVWCTDQGRDHAGTVQTFGRDLRAIVPRVKVIHPREGDVRTRKYEGIGLHAE